MANSVCDMIELRQSFQHANVYRNLHSHIQYSLSNWGRASKSHFHKLSILQNKILRACLFCSRHYEINLLYSMFRILKLDDMTKMEFAKFIFKYSNNMLPNSFNNYFIKLENIHNYNTNKCFFLLPTKQRA